METTILKKRKSFAFGKDIYLLGINQYGEKMWLEAPSWDCGWYWGFGYIETYTDNNNPSKAQDITMHTHIDSYFNKIDGKIDLNNSSYLTTRTFNNEEGNYLNSLFNQFYTAKEEANAAHKTNEERYNYLNKELIPSITKEILSVLNP
jgi:hypothetical protein